MGRTLSAVLLAGATIVAFDTIARATAAQDRADVAALIARVGDRVAAYYRRAQQLICTEQSTVTPIRSDWGPDGFARMVESELRVEMEGADGDGLPAARVTRQIRRINGREPRERDARDRSGCTDPTPQSPEMLTFLLPGYREEYRFTAVRDGRERDRAALVIDFTSMQRASRPELIRDEYGHDDCFDWKGPVAIRGRLWVDARTHDVLRLDRHLTGPTDIRVPEPLQRKYRFTPWLTLDRDDVTLRYKEVAFSDPDETLLLPESIEMVTVVRSGLQSTRRTQVFSSYRRFLTGSRIK
ncbi:MAG TPA: hypothetical protein VFK57_10260 [Vicinamibacterales bacterium]|nr:hypothetical protein [Vicinamibacterales bacterium]